MHTLNLYFFPQHRLFLRSCHAQNTKLSKMAVKKNNLAPLALRIQNIRYQEYFCMPCSVFDNDETSTVKGWKAGSIAYCKPCFREVMEEYVKVECND